MFIIISSDSIVQKHNSFLNSLFVTIIEIPIVKEPKIYLFVLLYFKMQRDVQKSCTYLTMVLCPVTTGLEENFVKCFAVIIMIFLWVHRLVTICMSVAIQGIGAHQNLFQIVLVCSI